MALASQGTGQLTYLTDPTDFNLGEWYHIAATYDGNTMRLYVDGTEKASSTEQSGVIEYPSSGWFQIGAYKDNNEDFRHDGGLDEVMIFDKALTTQEINQLYNNASNSRHVNLNIKEKSTTDHGHEHGVNTHEHLLVYPNPARGWINLVLPAYMKKSRVMIFNPKGQLASEIMTHEQSNQVIRINTTGYPNGTYIVFVEDESGNISSAKLIVE